MKFFHSIDPKGRLVVPAKLRDMLGGRFHITKGIEKCLYAYPEDAWEKLESRYLEMPTITEKARRFGRTFFGDAYDFEPDSQNRILLPVDLRDYAGIKKEVVLVSVIDRVEIWDQDLWKKTQEVDQSEMGDMAEYMGSLGMRI